MRIKALEDCNCFSLCLGYSTGKTVLMVNCAKALNEIGEKVLFVSANMTNYPIGPGEHSIQHQKLERVFKNDENIKLEGLNIGVYSRVSNKNTSTPIYLEAKIGQKSLKSFNFM